MKIIITIAVFVLGTLNAIGQINAISENFPLPASISESSGVIYFNNKLITHNDSGGNNELYEVDLITGLITRTVTILNTTNVDWEAMTQDETSIYIGDIGNNVSGNRTDLKIYKISKSDYVSTNSVTAQIISFSYSNQTDFTASNANTTEWDAESLVSFNTSNLMLFSKNWVNGITKAYLIPKLQGTYTISPLATTLNAGGLITGGTYNPLSGKLFLVGYSNSLMPVVWKTENFIGNDVFSGTNTQTSLFSSFSLEQIEAITFVDENSYLMTSEAFNINFGGFPISDYAKLMSFSTNDVALSVNEVNTKTDLILYPNPVNNLLHIKGKEIKSVQVFDMKFAQLYQGNASNINLSTFSKGVYFVKINFENNFSLVKKIVKE